MKQDFQSLGKIPDKKEELNIIKIGNDKFQAQFKMKEVGTRSGSGPDDALMFNIASDNSSGDIHMCSSLTGESSKSGS